jgi:prepilin-type N-terminal cleavage/methylation domain-containing protein
MRRAFTLIELLVVIAIVAILVTFALEVPAVSGPVRLVFWFLFGWVPFLWRLLWDASIDPEGTTVFVVCLALLLIGTQATCRWLYGRRGGESPRRWAWRWTISGLLMVVVAAGAGISALAVVHESVWLVSFDGAWVTVLPARRYAWDSASQNNLKQMAMALDMYHETHKKLPAGATFDAHGRVLHGWQTLMLPYVEQAPLYRQIELDCPWDDPHNLPAMKQVISIYLNPRIAEDKSDGLALSHYAGNVHVLGPRPMSCKEITDGVSNTVLLGEVAAQFKPWGRPANWRDPAVGLNKSPDGFGRPGGEYVFFAFADGSVRRIADTVSPQFLRAISTPAGGEPVPPED